MENKKKKSTGLLLSILGVISLILITAGVTYAFFSYAKQGTTNNTIRTGTITFVYNEKTSTGLTIQNALPKSDSVGMAENGNGFEFTVTSDTPSTATIDYLVTARVKAGSTLPENQVKLYLTSTDTTASTAGAPVPDAGGNGYGSQTGDTAGSIKTFDQLTLVSDNTFSNVINGKTIDSNVVERVIYKGKIATNSSAYTRTFKLNMWLLGAEEKCFVDGTVDTTITTQANCVAPSGSNAVYEWKADPAGIADYSAYEFVKVSSITAASATEYKIVDAGKKTTGATDELEKGVDILTSVTYYNQLESQATQADKDAFAAQYTRLAAVNQDANKVFTVAQKDANQTVPTGNGWEATEQFYPLNGQTFTVTINVYAEGATTYTVPASNSGN